MYVCFLLSEYHDNLADANLCFSALTLSALTNGSKIKLLLVVIIIPSLIFDVEK